MDFRVGASDDSVLLISVTSAGTEDGDAPFAPTPLKPIVRTSALTCLSPEVRTPHSWLLSFGTVVATVVVGLAWADVLEDEHAAVNTMSSDKAAMSDFLAKLISPISCLHGGYSAT